MNLKRIFIWLGFIIIVGLVIWGLIAADKKSKRLDKNTPLVDQVVSTDHVLGSPLAKVTIVEYSDFQCPACKAFHYLVDKFMAEQASSTATTTVRFVYRHFPLPQHGNAISSTKASEAAGAQGKFFEMYGILFERQSDWENSTDAKSLFLTYALELGLDKDKFLSDYDRKDFEEIINNSYRSGVKAGVQGTPTFFINGKMITNPQSYDEFKEIIKNATTKSSIQ